MKKQTLSAVLTAIMICLTLAIVVLVVKIAIRGPKPVEEESLEVVLANENTVPSENSVSANEEAVIEATSIIAIPQTATSVNVRCGPGVDYDRLGSAYANCEYVVIEVLDNGWTHIEYDDDEGYISSEFLSYQKRMELSDGSYSYSAIEEKELDSLMKKGTTNAVSADEAEEQKTVSDNN